MRLKLSIVVLPMLVAACGDLPDDGSSSEAAGPPITVSSTDLAAAFDANEMAAKQQYGGHTLIVTGKVQSIDLDFMDNAVVMLPGKDDFTQVHATIAESEKQKAGALVKGQDIAVTCTELTEVLGSPMLDNCTF